MHFLAVALVYAAADSSKDSDTTLTGETQMHYLIAIAPLMSGLNNLFFLIYCTTDTNGQSLIMKSACRKSQEEEFRQLQTIFTEDTIQL